MPEPSAKYDKAGFDPYMVRCSFCNRIVKDEHFTAAQLMDYSLTGVCALCQNDISAATARWDAEGKAGQPGQDTSCAGSA